MTPTSPTATRHDWLRLVGGDKGLAALASKTLDGIILEALTERASDAPLLGRSDAACWDIRPLHAAADPLAVRAAVAEDIAGGASSIALKLATPGDFGLPPRYDALAAALDGVPLERVQVSLISGDQYFGAVQVLMALWERTGRNARDIRAGVHADPLGTLARTGALEMGLWPTLELFGQFVSVNCEPWPHVRLLLADGTLYHDAGASEVQELAAMLATVVDYLRVLDFEDVAPEEVFRHLTVGLAADADLFATIAKLRAARLLLARLGEAMGTPAATSHVEFWVTTSQRMLASRVVHNNILRNAIAALGAALGGADTITVLPHTWALGEPDAAARRLARNTQLLMAKESRLARVLDPGAGSGHITALTEAFAARAWALFQEIEASGGMARALLSGKMQEAIADMVARRDKELVEGRLAIVGLTAFTAEEGERLAPTSHPPAAPIERAETRVTALPVRRLSAALEVKEARS